MTYNPYSLEGKLALVTGAGTGIGKGVALELARQGADVVLHYAHNSQGALDAVEQIKTMGHRAHAVQADLRQVNECLRLVDEASEFLGGLDGLVSNAGLTATIKFLDMTEERFDRIFNLNIRGEYFCAQQAVRHMLKRGEELRTRFPDRTWPGASIVNISSVHGAVGCAAHTAYAGTKGAINAFSRALAVELCPQHIRVNVIAPGTIEVPSYYTLDPGYTTEIGGKIVPWGRVGFPADVGYLAAYLLSDASEFMTGHVLYFDGGLTAKMALPIQPTEGERAS
jgi:NAD(P)-dependent dehydrogenase (short-subunit alcohol dehydrogenase family)